MHLVHSKDAFNHSKNYVFPFAPRRTLIKQQTGLFVALFFTTWLFDLKNRDMSQSQHRDGLQRHEQGRREVQQRKNSRGLEWISIMEGQVMHSTSH